MARRTKPKVLTDLIAEGLQARGVSQPELAQHLGVSQQAVSKWVRGLSKPRPGHVAEMAQFLGLDYVELRTAAGYSADDLRADTWRFAYERGYADATEGRLPAITQPDSPLESPPIRPDESRAKPAGDGAGDMLHRLAALEEAVKRHGEMLDAVLAQLPALGDDGQPRPSSQRSAPSTARRS